MSKVLLEKDTLMAMADVIRRKTGGTGGMSVSDMIDEIGKMSSYHTAAREVQYVLREAETVFETRELTRLSRAEPEQEESQ